MDSIGFPMEFHRLSYGINRFSYGFNAVLKDILPPVVSQTGGPAKCFLKRGFIISHPLMLKGVPQAGQNILII